MSGGQGMGIVVIAAALGALVTLATKHEPGSLLGGFVVAGSLAAGVAVRPRSAYLMIPVPALSYLVFALAAGLVRNQTSPSSSGLTVSAAQWVANGFLTMAAATVVAILITAGRWFWARRAHGAEAGRAEAGRAEAGRRPQAGSAGRGRPDTRETRGPRETRGARDARPDPGARPRAAGRRDPRWLDERGDSDLGDWNDSRHQRGWSDPRDEGGRGRDGGRGGDSERGDWDRRPPPGPPSFGSPRDLATVAWYPGTEGRG
jgi:hypothetical protein